MKDFKIFSFVLLAVAVTMGVLYAFIIFTGHGDGLLALFVVGLIFFILGTLWGLTLWIFGGFKGLCARDDITSQTAQLRKRLARIQKRIAQLEK